MKEIHTVIRNLREDHDNTQAEIATFLGISQQYYSQYERGSYEIPVRHLISIADLYGASMDYVTGLSSFEKRVEDAEQPFTAETTVGDFMSSVLKLDLQARVAVKEFVEFQLSKN